MTICPVVAPALSVRRQHPGVGMSMIDGNWDGSELVDGSRWWDDPGPSILVANTLRKGGTLPRRSSQRISSC
jgi:hypothetical protein